MDLRRTILFHVHDNSGGIKFTDLLFKILDDCHKNHVKPVEVEELENVCEDLALSGEIGILRYTWKAYNREKMFIYTP